jgi:hypothetical protein
MSVCNGASMTLSPRLRLDDGYEREMASTESDLGFHHPGVAAAEIHTLVQRAYVRLMPAKVHNYLPILIAREVQAELRDRHAA